MKDKHPKELCDISTKIGNATFIKLEKLTRHLTREEKFFVAINLLENLVLSFFHQTIERNEFINSVNHFCNEVKQLANDRYQQEIH